MQDPIHHEPPPFDRVRKNKLEALRQLSLWLALSGVLVYIFGEVLERETAVHVGIWLLLAGLAAGVLYKVLSYVAPLLAK